MKITKVFCIVIMFISSSTLFGQTKSDSLKIKETVLNYLEGLNTNDYLRAEKAIHPELAKRIISTDKNGDYKLDNMPWSHLLYNIKTVDFSQMYKADVNLQEPFKVEVIIFDIQNNIATIKANQNRYAFFDYIHLGKIKDEWKIINILWAWTD